MKEERIKLLEELYEAATQLVSYTSYAEIVGAISHNRSAIRKYCDEVQEINAKIKHMDENKRFKVKIRQTEGKVINPKAKPIDGNVYNFSFGWIEDEGVYKGEKVWLPMDETYPKDAPTYISEGDLEVIDG